MRSPRLLAALGIFALAGAVSAQTTINAPNSYAWAANAGWINARGDATNGVVIGEYVCSGFAWGANIGWINFGGGVPANQVQYLNNSATDFGVNLQQDGRLRGFAWGANVGWINFEATGDPKVDLLTGNLSGYAWSANLGWINLGDLTFNVRTDTIRRGVDSNGNGIADAWEILNFGNLTTATAISDFDKDGISDLQEYFDGTDPKDPSSILRITAVSKAASTISLTWTSTMGRFYRVEQNPTLLLGSTWTDLTGLFAPSGGATSSRNVTDSTAKSFFRVRAQRTPLLGP